ncbi:MAG: DUF370 domain-containing protein [Clostridia bacterium]|nr:DUF370 domain-containing protein [Clostridia bacterium]
MNEFVDIGAGGFIALGRTVAVVAPDSAPVKRAVAEAKEKGRAVDASGGKKTLSVIFTDSDLVILSSYPPDRITGRQ